MQDAFDYPEALRTVQQDFAMAALNAEYERNVGARQAAANETGLVDLGQERTYNGIGSRNERRSGGALESGSKAISQADRIKIEAWDYKPSDGLYLKYKDVFDNPKYYNQKTGSINWPKMMV